MNKLLFRLVVCVFVTYGLLAAPAAFAAAAPDRPTVGAIRWDYWMDEGRYAGADWLGDSQWHDRVPFFGRVVSKSRVEILGDRQKVMDREIQYAYESGPDYWAFGYNPPRNGVRNYGLDLYRTSEYRHLLDYTLILSAALSGSAHDAWNEEAAFYVERFQDKTYHKVMNGRPLVFVYEPGNFDKPEEFGSTKATREAFDHLRSEAHRSGLEDPYIVGMAFDARTGGQDVERYGFDAITTYSAARWLAEPREVSYTQLARDNQAQWSSQAKTGNQVIPTMNVGWDPRPLTNWDYYNPSGKPFGWYAMPTPKQLADNLNSALGWVRANPKAAPADTLLIYAWNEYAEGGWLTPNDTEGTARLDAIGTILGARTAPGTKNDPAAGDSAGGLVLTVAVLGVAAAWYIRRRRRRRPS